VVRLAPKAAIVGIDLLPTDPIDGVTIPPDIFRGRRRARTAEGLGGPADWCCPTWRQARSAIRRPTICATMGLVEAGMLFAAEVLRPGGAYIAKVLAGGAEATSADLKRHLPPSKRKPPANAGIRRNGT
jgi:23S rRNA (uridine2552-2'-O)-methyltransferase